LVSGYKQEGEGLGSLAG